MTDQLRRLHFPVASQVHCARKDSAHALNALLHHHCYSKELENTFVDKTDFYFRIRRRGHVLIALTLALTFVAVVTVIAANIQSEPFWPFASVVYPMVAAATVIAVLLINAHERKIRRSIPSIIDHAHAFHSGGSAGSGNGRP